MTAPSPDTVVLPDVDTDGPVGLIRHVVCVKVLDATGPTEGICGARLRGIHGDGLPDCAMCDDLYPGHVTGCDWCKAWDARFGGPL